MQTTVFYYCGKTNTQHITKLTVLYNLGKQNTNIKQTLQYYTMSGNNTKTLYKHHSIILSQGTKCKHYTDNAVF